MSRGPGTHQRRLLAALRERGWLWMVDLPSTNRSDATSYWRAARRLERLGHLQIEHRSRRGYLRRFALLVSVMQVRSGTALPIDEPYWGDEVVE